MRNKWDTKLYFFLFFNTKYFTVTFKSSIVQINVSRKSRNRSRLNLLERRNKGTTERPGNQRTAMHTFIRNKKKFNKKLAHIMNERLKSEKNKNKLR